MANLVEEMKKMNSKVKGSENNAMFEVVDGKIKQKVTPEQKAKYDELMSGFLRRKALVEQQVQTPIKEKGTKDKGLGQ